MDRMSRYKYRKQTLVVMACCILHNFIKMHNLSDENFDTTSNRQFPHDNLNLVEREDLPEATEMAVGEKIRNNIRNTL
jgi:hypothetical protein